MVDLRPVRGAVAVRFIDGCGGRLSPAVLAIATVQRLPAEAGVDMADLAEADPHTSSSTQRPP